MKEVTRITYDLTRDELELILEKAILNEFDKVNKRE